MQLMDKYVENNKVDNRVNIFFMQLMDKYVENNKVDNRVNIFFLDALLIVAQGIAGGVKMCVFSRKTLAVKHL